MEENQSPDFKLQLRSFLLDQKNRRLIILAVSTIFLFIVAGIVMFSALGKSPVPPQNKTESSFQPASALSPTLKPVDTGEKISGLGYSIDCQVIATTTERKLYIQKLPSCNQALRAYISASGKFASYVIGKSVYVYSLANNTIANIGSLRSDPVDMTFFSNNSLGILLNQTEFEYVFIPLLFGDFPANFDTNTQTFTDLSKKTVLVNLPPLASSYARLGENSGIIQVEDRNGKTLFTLSFDSLLQQLTPTPAQSVNRSKLDWSSRLLLYTSGVFETIDPDGSNLVTHPMNCGGKSVVPLDYYDGMFARSPDGTQLAFVVPDDNQAAQNQGWQQEVLAQKNVFSDGKIALYDLLTDSCTVTDERQSLKYAESMAFSPNGLYLAHVYNGLSLYVLQTQRGYDVTSHRLNDTVSPSLITGPLIWDDSSKFIFMAVTSFSGNHPLTTKLDRVYFNKVFEGTEEEIVTLDDVHTLYAAAPDGNRVLYGKGGNLYQYSIDSFTNQLVKSGTGSNLKKLVWLRNNTIVSNLWMIDAAGNSYDLPQSSVFYVDYNGGEYAYDSKGQVHVYDLSGQKEMSSATAENPRGTVLNLFY